MQLSLFKSCIDCGKELPASPEYFTRDKTRSDGLYPYCKACKKIRRTPYEQAHRVETGERALAWHYANRERHCAQMRHEYHADPQRYICEATEWQRRNPDKHKVHKHAYYLRNLDKYASYGRVRRARLQGLSIHHTPADVEAKYLAQNGACIYCGKALDGIFEIDHIVPLSRGGTDTAENIACACQFCNRSKGAKLVPEWSKC